MYVGRLKKLRVYQYSEFRALRYKYVLHVSILVSTTVIVVNPGPESNDSSTNNKGKPTQESLASQESKNDKKNISNIQRRSFSTGK